MIDVFQNRDYRTTRLLKTEFNSPWFGNDDEGECVYSDPSIDWVETYSKSKDTTWLCESKHEVKIGIRGDKDTQRAYEDAYIVAFRPKDSSGAGTSLHGKEKDKHKASIKVKYTDREGATKNIHDDTIAGGSVAGCSSGWNYQEYFFDRPGIYEITVNTGLASGDCAKPKGSVSHKLYVPEPPKDDEDTSANDDTSSDTDDDTNNGNETTSDTDYGGLSGGDSSNTKKKSVMPYLAVGGLGLLLMVASNQKE